MMIHFLFFCSWWPRDFWNGLQMTFFSNPLPQVNQIFRLQTFYSPMALYITSHGGKNGRWRLRNNRRNANKDGGTIEKSTTTSKRSVIIKNAKSDCPPNRETRFVAIFIFICNLFFLFFICLVSCFSVCGYFSVQLYRKNYRTK